MTVEIPAEFESFLQQELKTGRYKSAEDVVAEALRILQQERTDTTAGIKAGLEDVAAGRLQPLSEAFSDLRKEFSIPERE